MLQVWEPARKKTGKKKKNEEEDSNQRERRNAEREAKKTVNTVLYMHPAGFATPVNTAQRMVGDSLLPPASSPRLLLFPLPHDLITATDIHIEYCREGIEDMGKGKNKEGEGRSGDAERAWKEKWTVQWPLMPFTSLSLQLSCGGILFPLLAHTVASSVESIVANMIADDMPAPYGLSLIERALLVAQRQYGVDLVNRFDAKGKRSLAEDVILQAVKKQFRRLHEELSGQGGGNPRSDSSEGAVEEGLRKCPFASALGIRDLRAETHNAPLQTESLTCQVTERAHVGQQCSLAAPWSRRLPWHEEGGSVLRTRQYSEPPAIESGAAEAEMYSKSEEGEEEKPQVAGKEDIAMVGREYVEGVTHRKTLGVAAPGPSVYILYGTENGTAKKFAERIRVKLSIKVLYTPFSCTDG